MKRTKRRVDEKLGVGGGARLSTVLAQESPTNTPTAMKVDKDVVLAYSLFLLFLIYFGRNSSLL